MNEIVKDVVGFYVRTLRQIYLVSFRAGRRVGYVVGLTVGRKIEELLEK
jgi:hypothetical protein